VVVNGINGGDIISFKPVILTKGIREGARVITENSETELAATLSPGRRTQAKLENTGSLSPGDIVRIIRNNSLRMKFDPYYQFPIKVTRIVGKVSERHDPAIPGEPTIPLPDATVSLMKINDIDITWAPIGGVDIATVEIGGTKLLLGTAKDLIAATNHKGDYNLYFDKEIFIIEEEIDGGIVRTDLLEKVTLTASKENFQDKMEEISIKSTERKVGNFELAKD
ncbi:MAG: hypothetical protein GWN62_35330, partial [Aliifodinibius sp.]|nr:hypothetical protein [Fodinibius sp.]